MGIEKSIESIIRNAKLEILQYDIERRTVLQQKNRTMNCYIVSYIKEGSCRLHMNGMDYIANSGDVLIIPPNVRHDHVKDTTEETYFMWWHFNYKICDTIDLLGLYQLPVCFHIQDSQEIERSLKEYISCSKNPNGISGHILKEAKSLELIATLLNLTVRQQDTVKVSSSSNVFMSILSDITQNIAEPCYLKKLGEKYHMHPTYISNQFKKIYGITPIQLQKELRINEAKRLLLYKNLSISEVANAVGYENTGDFTRFFKAKIGLSPMQYKKSKMYSDKFEPI